MVFVLLKAEDNPEAAMMKDNLTSRLSERSAARLIKEAFRKLKPLVPGLEGKERLFKTPPSETLTWRELRSNVEAAAFEIQDCVFGV